MLHSRPGILNCWTLLDEDLRQLESELRESPVTAVEEDRAYHVVVCEV
jgi:hypothetical protein